MADDIHPLAARGFDAAADAYERGRPDYPAEAVSRDRRVAWTWARDGRCWTSLPGPGS